MSGDNLSCISNVSFGTNDFGWPANSVWAEGESPAPQRHPDATAQQKAAAGNFQRPDARAGEP